MAFGLSAYLEVVAHFGYCLVNFVGFVGFVGFADLVDSVDFAGSAGFVDFVDLFCFVVHRDSYSVLLYISSNEPTKPSKVF